MKVDETINDVSIEDIDRLIHEPARLNIVLNLFELKKTDFVDLAQKTGLVKGNLSIHIKKLQQKGYVEVFKNYLNKVPRTIVNLTPKGRESIVRYKKTMELLLGPIR